MDEISTSPYGILAFIVGRVPAPSSAVLLRPSQGWHSSRSRSSSLPPPARLRSSADGEPATNGINELTTVETGCKDRGIMLRGLDVEKPVLLFLAGGPGGSELRAMRNHLQELEQHFVVATPEYRAVDPCPGRLACRVRCPLRGRRLHPLDVDDLELLGGAAWWIIN
ncbi:hypothetical protein [Arthrobacter sp. HLT1-21]